MYKKKVVLLIMIALIMTGCTKIDSNIDNIPSVIIGLKMIPLISEKNIDSLFYVCGEEESKMSMPIYYIIFDFHTPHFRIMMKYHYVSPVV